MVHISGGKEKQYPLVSQTECWATKGEERSQKNDGRAKEEDYTGMNLYPLDISPVSVLATCTSYTSRATEAYPAS